MVIQIGNTKIDLGQMGEWLINLWNQVLFVASALLKYTQGHLPLVIITILAWIVFRFVRRHRVARLVLFWIALSLTIIVAATFLGYSTPGFSPIITPGATPTPTVPVAP